MVAYQALADAVLLLHFGVAVFVVGGLAFPVAGNVWHWRGANNFFFRFAHLGAIVFVVVQAWLGQYCPLTTLESWLRVKAGSAAYSTSFIEHWLQRIIFYEAPPSPDDQQAEGRVGENEDPEGRFVEDDPL